MRYKGDGSYESFSGIKPEVSLMDLLNSEDMFVGKVNEAQASFVKAQKQGYNVGECSRKLEYYKQQLEAIRQDIRDYFVTNLKLKSGIVDQSRIRESSGINLSRLRKRDDNIQNNEIDETSETPINLSRLKRKIHKQDTENLKQQTM